MPAKLKLRCQYRGKTFTRTTHNPYTVAVCGVLDERLALARAIRQAQGMVVLNWAYYLQEAGDHPRHPRTDADLAHIRRTVALGLDRAQEEAAVEASRRHGLHKARFEPAVLSWHRTHELAAKACRKLVADGHHADLAIVPVEGGKP